MANTPTPHIEARQGEISERIILPGDPLRAKFIAENFLTDVKQFNRVRNMLGFTGRYKGVEVSVMGTGMGTPSMGIYSYELINFYGCKTLIRTGSIGAMRSDIGICDLILAQAACWTTTAETVLGTTGTFCPIGDFEMLRKAADCARDRGIPYHVGNVLTSEFFYKPGSKKLGGMEWGEYGVLGVEMETAMLYLNAMLYGARALSILTVSNSLVTGEFVSSDKTEKGFTDMMVTALEVAVGDVREAQ